MKTVIEKKPTAPSADAVLIALSVWQRRVGISDVTIWRWRRKQWLRPLNISGRLYLRSDDIAQFEARAAAGEFSRPASGAARKKELIAT